MNRNSVIGIVSVIVLGLCFLSMSVGAGAYIYQDELQAYLGMQTSQKTAALLPIDTEFYLAMTPNIQAISGYENLKTLYLDNPEIKAILRKAQQDRGQNSFDFQADMLPWLGTEVVVAIPTFSTVVAQNKTTPPDFIISFQSRDRSASDKFIAKEITSGPEPYTEETYQGITIYTQKQKTGDYEQIVLIGLNDLVIFASQSALVKDMIDRSQGSNAPSFINNTYYHKIAAELPPEAIANLYIKTGNLVEAILQESNTTLPNTTLQDLRSFEALGVAMLLRPNGIQFEGVMSYDLSKMTSSTQTALKNRPSSPNAILQHVPAKSLMMINGIDLNQIWQNIKANLKSNPDFEMQLTDMETEMGFSIDEDMFSWMTGEYALVFVDAPPPNAFTPRGGGYLLVGSSDLAQAQTHVQTLTTAMQKSMGPFMSLKPQTVQGIELTVPENPLDPSFTVGYGFHDDYFVAAYREEAVKTLAQAQSDSISSQTHFKAVQTQLPTPNAGYVYANVDLLRSVFEGNLKGSDKKEYETSLQPFVKPIHALGTAGSLEGFDKGLSKGSLFLLISE